MSAAHLQAIVLALLASFIIWTIFDVAARIQVCKATGGYLHQSNSVSFECVKEP